MIKINEVYKTIQGESSYTGIPTAFVRTSGCPLRCHYCDSEYAFVNGEKYSIEQIADKVRSFQVSHVCVTGGEPLAQKNTLALMTKLCDEGYEVSLETSGSFSCQQVDTRVKKVVDVKTPDSGAPNTFLTENLNYLTEKDEMKFVICSENDFNWSTDFIRKNDLTNKCAVLISPSHQQVKPQWLAEKVLKENLKVRLQLQLHKYIWSEQDRGI